MLSPEEKARRRKERRERRRQERQRDQQQSSPGGLGLQGVEEFWSDLSRIFQSQGYLWSEEPGDCYWLAFDLYRLQDLEPSGAAEVILSRAEELGVHFSRFTRLGLGLIGIGPMPDPRTIGGRDGRD